MLQKLEQIEKNYEELTAQISSPEIMSDMSTYAKTMKQHRSLEEIVKNVFSVSKSFIVKLNTENKDTIARRKNAFEFFQDLMMLSGQSLATMRVVDNADIRTHVDMIAVSIVKMHPMKTSETEEVWG